MDRPLVFNDKELNKFLLKFDAINLKYDINKDSELYDDILNYERVTQPTDYTKKDTVSFIENTSLVYGGNDKISSEFLWRYKTTFEKLLNQYVHINGLARACSHNS